MGDTWLAIFKSLPSLTSHRRFILNSHNQADEVGRKSVKSFGLKPIFIHAMSLLRPAQGRRTPPRWSRRRRSYGRHLLILRLSVCPGPTMCFTVSIPETKWSRFQEPRDAPGIREGTLGTIDRTIELWIGC